MSERFLDKTEEPVLIINKLNLQISKNDENPSVLADVAITHTKRMVLPDGTLQTATGLSVGTDHLTTVLDATKQALSALYPKENFKLVKNSVIYNLCEKSFEAEVIVRKESGETAKSKAKDEKTPLGASATAFANSVYILFEKK